HPGELADGVLGGVDAPGGGVDGVGGGPVAAGGELAELAVGDAVVVHGLLLFIPGAGRGGCAPPGGGARRGRRRRWCRRGIPGGPPRWAASRHRSAARPWRRTPTSPRRCGAGTAQGRWPA